MGRRNIEKTSVGYFLLRSLANFWLYVIHYRRIIIIGRENIDFNKPRIYAPNHQNALMDAIAVVCSVKGQKVFLARADIFKKRPIAKILYSLKILPVYRIRDGYDSLKNNDEIFNKTIDVIRSRKALVILPEGQHAGYRRLKQLKKGIFRIAMQSEEATDFSLDIQIIPTGVDYSDYHKLRSVLTVYYGKAIPVSEFATLYKENPQKAYNELKDRLSDEMKKYMVHIESEDDYEAINELRNIINIKYTDSTREPKLVKDKELVDKVIAAESDKPKLYRQICNRSLKIKHLSKVLKTGYRHLSQGVPGLAGQILRIFSLIVLLPFFVTGFILNYITYIVPKLPLRKIKDVMFHDSVRWVLSLIVGLILLIVYSIMAFIFIPVWWIALIAILLVLPLGILAWNYTLIWEKMVENMRIRRYIKKKRSEYRILKTEYTELLNDLTEI